MEDVRRIPIQDLCDLFDDNEYALLCNASFEERSLLIPKVLSSKGNFTPVVFELLESYDSRS